MLHLSTSGNIKHTALHEYLIVNIPSFRRTFYDGNGDERMSEDNGRVHFRDGIITIYFAEDIDTDRVRTLITQYKELNEVN